MWSGKYTNYSEMSHSAQWVLLVLSIYFDANTFVHLLSKNLNAWHLLVTVFVRLLLLLKYNICVLLPELGVCVAHSCCQQCANYYTTSVIMLLSCIIYNIKENKEVLMVEKSHFFLFPINNLSSNTIKSCTTKKAVNESVVYFNILTVHIVHH